MGDITKHSISKIIIISIFFVLCCKCMKLDDKFTLEGTYYGDAGYAYQTKLKVLNSIKSKLVNENHYTSEDINIQMHDYMNIKESAKFASTYNEDINSGLDPTQFNIFLIKNGIRTLIATSDSHKANVYYEYLKGVNLDLTLESFVNAITYAIINKYNF